MFNIANDSIAVNFLSYKIIVASLAFHLEKMAKQFIELINQLIVFAWQLTTVTGQNISKRRLIRAIFPVCKELCGI